ncbi:MAG TPA: sugar phosphate nucleotidyltransferase [Acidimicrobiales bacterium]|nr:sugar phosphate nucleotidyltransferase [Acidimicrobiales bacterium]
MSAPDFAAVVLAAGLGNRLRPLTEVLPKPLCPVNLVPLVDLAIAHVRTVAIDVAVNVHHHRTRMEEHLSGAAVHVSIEEAEPLGTAGAIGNLRGWIDGRSTVIHNSDAWHGAEIDRLLRANWDGERIRLLTVSARPGLADFDDGSTFAGVSLMPWRDVERLEPVPSGLWEVSWREATCDGRVERVHYDGPWFDTGTPSSYLAANLAANDGRSVVAPDAAVEGDAEVVRSVVWAGATVGAGERLIEQIRIPGPITVDAPQ